MTLLQLRAQLEVLTAATAEKLSRLEGGDFEESDEDLDNFLQELRKVRRPAQHAADGWVRPFSGHDSCLGGG